MLKRLTILAVLLTAAFFAFSAAASAETPEEEEPGHSAANPFPSPFGLVVHSSHGYAVIVNAARGGRVSVEAAGPHGSITYTAPGSVSDAGIHADLGRYGRIDMDWVPNGQVRKVRRKCREGEVRRRYYDDGEYVGTLHFTGAADFTSVDAERVAWNRAWFDSPYPCGFSLGTAEPGAGVVIQAGKRGHIRGPLHLYVYRDHYGAKVEYSAHSEERKGPIEITRYGFAEAGSDSLTLAAANGTTTATIAPPAPFYGQATFERHKGSKGTLTGDLGVEFPDHTKVALAGKGFEATLRLESISITPR